MQKHEYTVSVPTTKTFYVSDDGVSFDTEEECRAHETKFKAIVDYVDRIQHKFADLAEVESYAGDCDQIIVFYTSVPLDIFMIQQWADLGGSGHHDIATKYKAGDVLLFDCGLGWESDGMSVRYVTDVYECLGTPDEYKKRYISAIDKVVQS